MWKWVSGCLVAFVIAAACVAWWGLRKYQSFTAGGGSTSVTIAASPERVFASLANADSLPTWTQELGTVRASHHGMLRVGDTLRLGTDSSSTTTDASGRVTTVHEKSSTGFSINNHEMMWIVAEVRPGAVLAIEMLSDNGDQVFGVERDSLIAAGDSTRVVSTTESPAMDSLVANAQAKGKPMGSAMLDAGSRLMLSAFRTLYQTELEHMKARIEGR